jgi:hypothetical protein
MAHFMFTVSSRSNRVDARSRVLVWRCELSSLPSPPFVSSYPAIAGNFQFLKMR